MACLFSELLDTITIIIIRISRKTFGLATQVNAISLNGTHCIRVTVSSTVVSNGFCFMLDSLFSLLERERYHCETYRYRFGETISLLSFLPTHEVG